MVNIITVVLELVPMRIRNTPCKLMHYWLCLFLDNGSITWIINICSRYEVIC